MQDEAYSVLAMVCRSPYRDAMETVLESAVVEGLAQYEEMTQEEIIAWYLERAPLAQESKVKRMEKSFGDTWTVQTQNGLWFEVGYDAGLKEVTDLTGPYPEIPVH